MGDATNLVLILAGELLKVAEHLLIMGLHPSEVTQGYEMAAKKALDELETLSVSTLPTPLTQSTLTSALKSAIASKQYGAEDILASLVAEAALIVMPQNPKNFNVDNVRVVKIMGGSLPGSKVVRGMVFNREPEGMVKSVRRAKVAVYTSGLDIAQTETKGTVLLHNAEEMLNFTSGEEKHMEKVCIICYKSMGTRVIFISRFSKKSQTLESRSSLLVQQSASLHCISSTVWESRF